MKRTVIILSALVLSGALAEAQQPRSEGGGPPPEGRSGPRMGRDPMMENLFPPPVIHAAEEELGLSDEQKKSIKEEMEKTRESFGEMQKKLQAEMEELGKFLKAVKVDEKLVQEQLDKVLAAESEIKKAHLASLIRVKNLLTAEQQEKLRKFMKEHRRPDRDGPGRERKGGEGPEGERGQDQQRPKPPQE